MKITNVYGLPEPFVDAAKSDHTYTPKRYSVTSVLKGTCESILTRRHAEEIETDASDMVWLIFGSAVHKVLEEGKETSSQLKEEWLSMELPNGYTLSGIFDLYDDSTGMVTDYKTASVWKVQFNDWEDYRKQLLSYVVLLRENGFPNARSGQVVALLKDFSPTKAQDPDYPQHPVHKVWWNFSDEEIEDWRRELVRKFYEIEYQENQPDEYLDICTPEERWQKPAKYAVTKVGNKRASKVCDTMDEAESAKAYYEGKDGKKYEITHRPGEDTKCMKYCACRDFCRHYKEIIAESEEQ